MTLLPFVITFSHLVTLTIVYGIFDGAFIAFILPLVATTVPQEQIGEAFGMLYTFISVEILFGAPLAGKVVESLDDIDNLQPSQYEYAYDQNQGINQLKKSRTHFEKFEKKSQKKSQKVN